MESCIEHFVDWIRIILCSGFVIHLIPPFIFFYALPLFFQSFFKFLYICPSFASPDYLKYPVAAWSPQNKFALFYLPDVPNPQLNLSRFPRPRLTWIDPRTGNRLPGRPDNIQPPAAGDWLLLVR